jgi:type IV pilus assembly protein PilP
MARLSITLPLLLLSLLLPWSLSGLYAQEREEEKSATLSPYIYEAEGRRNPFQIPPGMVGKESGVELLSPQEIRPVRQKEYLERFQLDSLELVAILFRIRGQGAAAMVQDPEGKGHLVRVGHYLGVNEGKISRITDGEVTIIESLPGRRKKLRTITLRLHKKDGQ